MNKDNVVPILFLDFDGVLRRYGSPLYKLESELVDNLEEVLRAAPTVKIIITSSWREAFGLNEMRALFSADIAEGMLTLRDAGIRQVIIGNTSLEEVMLQTRSNDELYR